MSHTYSSNRLHLIFSTKNREKRLPVDVQPKLWAYMAGIAHNHGFEAIQVGGFDDHCHALIVLPTSMPTAKAAQTIKGCSSKWLNETGAAGKNFTWQEGYGSFSVSASQTEDVVAYIRNQPEHHRRHSFKEEFLEFLKRYGVAYDPKYVLG